MPRCRPRIARLVILLFALSAFPFSQLASSAQSAGLSPGGLVAYLDRANNLWVSQDNGDGAAQISTGGGFDGVVWSNDGTRLAMTSPANGGSAFIASPDPGFGVRGLHTGRDPRWASDSSRVAFIDSGTVHIFDRDGTYQRSSGVGADAIDWSPVGHRIGFTVVTADPYMTGCPKLNLGWIDADTGASQIVARSFGKFAWAGDGRRLLYVSTDDGTVRSYDTHSGASQRLSGRLANPCGGPFFTTADGRQLLFLDYGSGGSDLVMLNIDTLQERVYRNVPVSFPSSRLPAFAVTVDPQGRYAYTVQSYPTTITRIDLQSDARTALLSNDHRMVLSFSPDRDRVALVDTPYGQPTVTSVRDLATGSEAPFTNVGWLAWEASPFTPPTLQAWDRVWNREDLPVAAGAVSRTWIWGPAPFATEQELFDQSPGGRRAVRYFDKSRMEVTNPGGDQSSPWYVTNGLLVRELISGQLQVGEDRFIDREPAGMPVTGDPDDTNGPTYAALRALLNAPPVPVGSEIRATIDRQGTIGGNGRGGVSAALLVGETNHTVADVFWTYLNSQGPVWDGANFVEGRLFDPTFFATGFPITEAYWTRVKVAGQVKDVLLQCFERRCLTYTPENPDGWKVEMGNVGRHYHSWSYGG